MTKKQMRFIAARKLALHWIKLYRPKRIYEWETEEALERLPDENVATWTAMNFMEGGGSLGFRLLTFIQAIDIRETRQLCLGEAVPASLIEEAEFVLKEALDLLAKCEKKFNDFQGGISVPEPSKTV
jgi:hypothetical protein